MCLDLVLKNSQGNKLVCLKKKNTLVNTFTGEYWAVRNGKMLTQGWIWFFVLWESNSRPRKTHTNASVCQNKKSQKWKKKKILRQKFQRNFPKEKLKRLCENLKVCSENSKRHIKIRRDDTMGQTFELRQEQPVGHFKEKAKWQKAKRYLPD